MDLPLWYGNRLLLAAQFPWRLLSIMSLPLAVLAGGVLLGVARQPWTRCGRPGVAGADPDCQPSADDTMGCPGQQRHQRRAWRWKPRQSSWRLISVGASGLQNSPRVGSRTRSSSRRCLPTLRPGRTEPAQRQCVRSGSTCGSLAGGPLRFGFFIFPAGRCFLTAIWRSGPTQVPAWAC